MNQTIIEQLKEWRDYSGSESDLLEIFKGYILIDYVLILYIIDCLNTGNKNDRLIEILQYKIDNERY